MLLLRIEKKNLYILTRDVEKCSGFKTITNHFRKLVSVITNVRSSSRSESSLYSISQE
jgi:hypothetical protein